MFSSGHMEHVVITNPHALLDAPTVLALTSRLHHFLGSEEGPITRTRLLDLPPSIYEILGIHVDATELTSWLKAASKVSGNNGGHP